MKFRRTCKFCGKTFTAVKDDQYFCCRHCWKRDYCLKKKILSEENDRTGARPSKRCDFCGEVSVLPFDPLKNPRLFNQWKCPCCGVPLAMLWKYEDEANITEKIEETISSGGLLAYGEIEYEYVPYIIPTHYPEQGSENMVILSCDIINQRDIMKINKKKLIFY